jgi:hypothetical protein
MHFKNIIKLKYQVVIGPATDLLIGSFYLNEEIF